MAFVQLGPAKWAGYQFSLLGGNILPEKIVEFVSLGVLIEVVCRPV